MSEHWDSGDAYESYVGRWSRLVAPRFLAWAGVPAGGAILDAGCGAGALGQAALAHGAARLVGLDRSLAYAAHAAGATRAAAPPALASYVVGDAGRLPFAAGVFDAAVSGLVLNFLPDPVGALRELRRVVCPGGVVAAYVWDYAGRMELMRHFWDAAIELAPEAAGPLDEGVRFPLCRPEPLAALCRAAGLAGVATAAIDVPTVFRDFADYWCPFLGGQGPAPGYAASLAPAERARLRERLRARLPSAPDGQIALVARAWAVRGVTGEC
ncbi:MAG TPA: class I SAM-dependent methyltransferase [Thermomicrobiales bacterium]|nr:class I SAM-dependent methyltransferase [Thermomicrobiales bacterium]